LSSRGHFIGQVIDDLDAIASQVRQRCALGQTDLNRILEDFFKELLNLTYDINLRNLNQDRLNSPGLDLGDPVAKVAYQVTSQSDSKKINDCLAKITDQQHEQYDRVYVFVIGERQKAYTLDPDLVAKYDFHERNIVGMTALCRDIMGLDLASLQSLHRKIADEQRRIRIELEPQLPDGTFATNALQFIEGVPGIRRSDASVFASHTEVDGLFDDALDARRALDAFIDELARLPRMTREFFGWMIDDADHKSMLGGEWLEMNADYLDAKCRNMPNFHSELRLLQARKFIDFDREEDHLSGVFRLWFPGTSGTDFERAFVAFMGAEGLSANTLFSTMNFTPFGPEPDGPAPPAKAKGRQARLAKRRLKPR
jgi:hypothetical protein